jgi:hypothetical protein
MWKLVQSGLSVVAGTAEPEYGREAIHPITDSILKQDLPIYRETTASDFNWLQPGYTNVETDTFYFTDLTKGFIGFAQVIHSNLMGVHTTAQFTFKLIHQDHDKLTDNIWTSTKLENFSIDGANFYADNLSIELKDNNQYHLKSSVTEESIVDLVITRLTPGVIFGKDGTTYYGDDINNPWGSMRHLFWPRCKVSGTVKTPSKSWEIDGYTMFVKALQGMKPHHAAKSWNFLNFQSENYAAIQMEFTTPPSYACTKINIGIVTDNEKILIATINNTVIHKNPTVDEVGWPVPGAIQFNYIKDKQDEEAKPDDKIEAKVSGELVTMVERVDVMAEIPQFVKNIVSNVAGAKPYIYQFCNPFEIEIGDVKEKGIGYSEATFISD